MYTSCHCNSPRKPENLCSCLQIYQPRYVLPPQVPGQLPQMSSPYPGAQVYMPMQPHMSVGPVGQNVPMAYYPMGAVYPPGSTVMVDGGFDAGARFTAGSSVTIPVSIQLGTATHTHTHIFICLKVTHQFFDEHLYDVLLPFLLKMNCKYLKQNKALTAKADSTKRDAATSED